MLSNRIQTIIIPSESPSINEPSSKPYWGRRTNKGGRRGGKKKKKAVYEKNEAALQERTENREHRDGEHRDSQSEKERATSRVDVHTRPRQVHGVSRAVAPHRSDERLHNLG